MHSSFSSLTRPIPAEDAELRRWRIAVNGESLPDVLHLIVDHPDFGTLTYGLTAGGYDGCTFHERGGGGSVILPFSEIEGELVVGLVEQERPHQGGLVLNAPRGFLDRDEQRIAAARRELLEEMGLDVPASALFQLPGAPANPNSTFFETAEAGEGVHFFALQIPEKMLCVRGTQHALVEGAITQDPRAHQSRLAEQIGEAVFLSWFEAATLSDMFTNAAVARLLAARRGTRRPG